MQVAAFRSRAHAGQVRGKMSSAVRENVRMRTGTRGKCPYRPAATSLANTSMTGIYEKVG